MEDYELERHYEPPPEHAGVKVLPPFIFLAFFTAAVFLEIFFGSNLFSWGAQIVIGVLFLSFGAGIVTWSITCLLNAGTNIPPNEPTLAIVTEGPYRYSRNPIYLGMILFYIGLIVALDIVWGLILLFPLVYVIIKYVIELEENYLRRKFKSEYKEYCSETRRWF